MSMQHEVMGVKLSGLSLTSVLERAQKTIDQKGRLLICTPNPEIVLQSQKDRDFRSTLSSFDIAVADGVGLLAHDRFMCLPRMKFKLLRYPVYLVEGLLAGISLLLPDFRKKSSRHSEKTSCLERKSGLPANAGGLLMKGLCVVKGRLLARKLLELANQNQWKVYLLGDKTALNARRILSKKFPSADIRAAAGAIYDQHAKPVNNKEYRKDINITKDIKKFNPDILLVGFGAPKQERWIARNARKTGAKVLMGVGGTFLRLFTPALLGPFEWLWRLVTGSNSIKRILSATIIFPWRSFLYKVKYG